MKPRPSAAATLVAASLAASAASADPVGWADAVWPTPEEALANPIPVPADCLDGGGANTCIALVQSEFGALQWRFVWASGDTETLCVDRATADLQVDCDAPDAVRHLPPLMICIHSPDGRTGGCGPMRDYVYRPTPTS
ncbi:hypothetical protein GGQ87_002998 [Brevundimonas alba]|uniref:Secreted protein n=1 Tax=Brevundimonas alba TaxID=74314 RepID=A0A7X5YMX0_9CAUL|nr:hypothetical protein [Brevundimonas alba]NJC42703.1 hypothetical protein [Brevundimonas alba]